MRQAKRVDSFGDDLEEICTRRHGNQGACPCDLRRAPLPKMKKYSGALAL
jgi:hypothetical protein